MDFSINCMERVAVMKSCSYKHAAYIVLLILPCCVCLHSTQACVYIAS